MHRLIVANVPPYDGAYDLDLDTVPLTSREWGWVKRLAGYLPLTIDEGLDGGDPELLSVFAVMALRRAGKIQTAQVTQVFEQLQDVPVDGTVRLEMDTGEEVDADPPTSESLSLNTSSPGRGSPTGTGTSGSHRSPTGDPNSAISTSARRLLVS